MDNSQTLPLPSSTFASLSSALSAVSTPSPRSPTIIPPCCCTASSGRLPRSAESDEEGQRCAHCRAWNELKSRLEERLVLAAKVGSALLEKHEEFVRGVQIVNAAPSDQRDRDLEIESEMEGELERFRTKVETLEQENTDLRKELKTTSLALSALSQTHNSLLSQHATLQSENTGLHTQISLLSTLQTRLSMMDNESQDLQQELAFESQRAKNAEAKGAKLARERDKLMMEVERLNVDLALLKESKEGPLKAKEREEEQRVKSLLERFGIGPEVSTPNNNSNSNNEELFNLITTLVRDTDALRQSNVEYENVIGGLREEVEGLRRDLLSHSRHSISGNVSGEGREDVRGVGAEKRVGLGWHQRVPSFSSPNNTPSRNSRIFSNRPSSPSISSSSSPYLSSTAAADPEVGITIEPDSPTPHAARRAAHRGSFFSQSHAGQFLHPEEKGEIQESSDSNDTSGHEDLAEKPHPSPHRSLLLLSRDRAVQTDPVDISSFAVGNTVLPSGDAFGSPLPSAGTTMSQDHYLSDASSSAKPSGGSTAISHENEPNYGVGSASTLLALLLTHSSSLLHRLSGTDVSSISARLARHNLSSTPSQSHQKPSSYPQTQAQKETTLHISRTTIQSLLTSFSQLRGQLRQILSEQEKMRAIKSASYEAEGKGAIGVEIVVTPHEFRELLNFVRGALSEVGALRGKLNELELGFGEKDPGGIGSGWIGGLSRLLAPVALYPHTHEKDKEKEGTGAAPTSVHAHAGLIMRKATPAPALPVTVNAAVSSGHVSTVSAENGTGKVRPRVDNPTIGRHDGVRVQSESHEATTPRNEDIIGRPVPVSPPLRSNGVSGKAPGNVMSIFAGSRTHSRHGGSKGDQEWVVLSRKGSRLFSSTRSTSTGLPRSSSGGETGFDGSAGSDTVRRRGRRRMSRNLDAILDHPDGGASRADNDHIAEEHEDEDGHQRGSSSSNPIHALRRRGLSDSSIHTTFMSSQSQLSPTSLTPNANVHPTASTAAPIGRQGAFPMPFNFELGQGGSVLQALQNLVTNRGPTGGSASSHEERSPVGAGIARDSNASPVPSNSSRGRGQSRSTGSRAGSSPSKSRFAQEGSYPEQKSLLQSSSGKYWGRGGLGRDM